MVRERHRLRNLLEAVGVTVAPFVIVTALAVRVIVNHARVTVMVVFVILGTRTEVLVTLEDIR